MRRFEFQAEGLNQEQARRLRKAGRHRTSPGRAAMWTVAVAALAYTINPIAIYVFNRPGKINISTLASDGSTRMFIPVSGTVQNPRVETLAINLNDNFWIVPVKDGVFGVHVPLVPGENRIVASTGGVSSNVIRVMRGSIPTATIGGKEITATRVLVMEDSSGSMDEDGIPARLGAQRQRLEEAGISIENRVYTKGFGVSTEGWDVNFIHTLERTLQGQLAADAIYFISDFDLQTEQVDSDNEAGYALLRQLLRKYSLRLYLATVEKAPSEELIRIARETGGHVIQSE